MNATKRAQVPFGLRKKLMAATSMLLVAAIMLVSTSYAWFTLSTAPEITGITTSVGANGNLEIALLTTETFNATDDITSNTGDSMAATNDVTVSNITWGNLVDLSHASYGLQNIKMYPSALNGDGEAVSALPLATPVYGADGRVEKLTGNTYFGIYNGTSFVRNDAGYGVRAVGISSNTSPAKSAYDSAKANFNMNESTAQTDTRNAVSKNMVKLLGLAGSDATTYTADEIAAMKEMIAGLDTSLKKIVAAYANAIIAYVAATETDETVIATVNESLSGVTNAADLKTKISGNTIASSVLSDEQLTELENAQSDVSAALAYDATDKTTDDIKTNLVTPLIGNTSNIKVYDNGAEVTVSRENITALMSADEAYLSGGAINTIAKFTGNFQVTAYGELVIYAGVKGSSTDYLATVKNNIPAFAGNATSTEESITNFYGYVVDFAFRTNAADSNLQLQTDAVNRVYSDATEATLATMGGGSYGTFDFSGTGLSATQAKNLLESYRVVFYEPDSQKVLATAKFEAPATVEDEATSITALLKLTAKGTIEGKYTLGKDAYDPVYDTVDTSVIASYAIKTAFKVGDVAMTADNCTSYAETLTVEDYNGLAATTVKADDTATETISGENTITALTQNMVQKVSMLVYLDGNNIDNADINAAGTSGTLKMNVQFSSSAQLQPMENSTLKNMEKAATNP